MATVSNNDIARTIYLILKDKGRSEQADIYQKVVRFLFKKRLLSKAPDILSRLQKIINQEENRVVAKVLSVEKLSLKTKTQLDQFLKKRYSAREVVLDENIDEKLLGGLKIEVDDEVIDLSIKNKVGKLQEYLTKTV